MDKPYDAELPPPDGTLFHIPDDGRGTVLMLPAKEVHTGNAGFGGHGG